MYNKSTKDKLECHIITLAMTVGLFSTYAVCESFLSSAAILRGRQRMRTYLEIAPIT